MSGEMIRAAMRRQREELAGWQKGALGLLLLAVLANLALGALVMKERRAAEDWKEEYIQAETARMEAVAAREDLENERAEMEAWAEKCAELPEYQYVGECVLTAYCCEKYRHICGTGTGLTASGLPVQPGMVAVDPDVIPLGSRVFINGVEYLAADIGGSIKGNKIDIAMETHQEADVFGRQAAEVWFIAPQEQ